MQAPARKRGPGGENRLAIFVNGLAGAARLGCRAPR